MYTNNFFPKFNSAVLFQKRASAQASSEDGRYYSAADSSSAPKLVQSGAANVTASGSLLLVASVGSVFVVLVLLAAAYYYQKKRSTSFGLLRSNHKVLLVKKDIIPGHLDKGFFINSYPTGPVASTGTPTGQGKTRAVRSPSSGQVNPFQKKSPSPTSAKDPHGIGSLSEEPQITSGKSATNEINNNIAGEMVHSNGKAKVLASVENVHNTTKEPQLMADSATAPTVTKKATEEVPNLGKLHFKLRYSYEKRALSVVVIRCEGLPGVKEGSNSTMDPYIKLQLLPEKQHKAKTRVLRKTQNPVYNEEFTFLGITANFLDHLVVHFVVLNFDRFSRDEILGEVICNLNQFEFDSLEKQITLSREIAPRGNKLKVQELGELLVSLCYQPIANRLTVVVLKARNLPKMDLTGLCDPYVKIYVFHNNQRIFKKRTHVKKRTLSPVYNESFVFDIPPEEGLDNIQMQFLVYDHDRVTRNELIGKIDISCKSGCPTTEKHWHEVIKSPRRQIAEWHKLKEC